MIVLCGAMVVVAYYYLLKIHNFASFCFVGQWGCCSTMLHLQLQLTTSFLIFYILHSNYDSVSLREISEPESDYLGPFEN